MAMKRRETKGKGEKDRHTPLNAEFQRTARRDKKAFLDARCKDKRKTIEWERLEISSKMRDTKGTFHAKMGTIKDRNGMDLREAEDIKKRWQEYTEDHTVQVTCSVVSDSLRPHESQHTRPPCPSPTPGVHPDSRPSSQ